MKKRLVIISGISGSGKSTVLDAFEDIGFYCVDNLPLPLLGGLAELLIDSPAAAKDKPEIASSSGSGFVYQADFALLLNFHEQGYFPPVQEAFPLVKKAAAKLRESGIEVSLLFLDCHDEVVIRRYSETRRPHPLLLGVHDHDTMQEALSKERNLLADFREAADRIIDTTSYTPHELRRVVEAHCRHENQLGITLVSFGYKYGVPPDADLVVDVRFLANPYFVSELRHLSGLEQQIADYIFRHSGADEFVQRYVSLLEYLIPCYQQEGKRYLTIGVGCTGGRHRAIAVVERISQELAERGIQTVTRHRDIGRA